jgi:hypothetical protein
VYYPIHAWKTSGAPRCNSETITALPVVSTRLSFLSQAAGVAAGGTGAATASGGNWPLASGRVVMPNPVFDQIEVHRRTAAACLIFYSSTYPNGPIGDAS